MKNKRYNSLDELIKDLSGPHSKFYKDWMKGKAKREAYSQKVVAKLMKNAKEAGNEEISSADGKRQRRKPSGKTPKAASKKPRMERRNRG